MPAGAYPAGSLPAGLIPTPPVAATQPRAARAIFLDPSTGLYQWDPQNPATLRELDRVDAKMAFLTSIPRGSLPISPDTGNTFLERLAATTSDAQRLPAAIAAANESYADVIAADDILIDRVTIDDPQRDVVGVYYFNLRAAQFDPTAGS
jgi:hypothetical protein